MDKPLKNPRHEQFVHNLLEGMSATEAYSKAYGQTGRTAGMAGSRLMKNDDIAARLSWLQRQVEQRALSRMEASVVKREVAAERAIERAVITKQAVLEELGKLAFANMLDYITVGSDGLAHVDLSKLDRDKAAAIQEVVVDQYMEGGGEDAVPVKKIRFKLADKKAALVDIGKHLGMFIDRKEVGGPGDFAAMTDEEIVQEIERLAEAEIANIHDEHPTEH